MECFMYVCMQGCSLSVQATELAIPLSEWLDYAKGKSQRSETDPLYSYLPNKLDKYISFSFHHYSDQLVSWCMWGLAGILKALKFVNEDAKQVHGCLIRQVSL